MSEQMPPQDTGEPKITGDGKERERGDDKPNGPSTDFSALIDTIKNEGIAYRKEEQREDSGKKFREWVTIALLVCTVIAIGWQVNEMIRVYGPIRDQARAEQKAADAAKISADAASKQSIAATQQSANSDRALEEAQRAWIGPDNATIDGAPTVGKPVAISITYHNTGKEPARSFVFALAGTVPRLADDLSGKLAAQFSDAMKNCFALKPRQNAGVVYPSTGFGGGNINMTIKGTAVDQDVVDGKKFIVVQGCFAYETFGKSHHSAFCYYWRGDVSKPPNMNICESGNNAD